jgi:hypothetical protein
MILIYVLPLSAPAGPGDAGTNDPTEEIPMNNDIVSEIEDTEQLAHLSASHSNALVENPFD